MNIKQYLKMTAQNVVMPAVYNLEKRKPVQKNLVIFADAHHDRRPENMEQLYEQLAADPSLEVREMYCDFGRAGVKGMLSYMKRFMKVYAQAGTVVICDNFLPTASCRKRPETMVVQLWHACGAYKKFGYDTTDDIPASYKGNVFQNTDLVTVSAEACRKPFSSAMRMPLENVQALGVSRTDRYFDPDWAASCKQKFAELYPQAAGKKVAVWAPTFRGKAGNPEKTDIDLANLQQELGDEWFVLASLHPHMAAKMNAGSGAARDFNARMTTSELFPVTDVLIADYSSLIYEYLLFGRSMVLFVPDLDEYSGKRGFYMEFSEIPGTVVTERGKLAEAICSERNENTERKEAFMKKYMAAIDGHSTERIAEQIVMHSKAH